MYVQLAWWKGKEYIIYGCNSKIIQEAGLHPVSYFWVFIFGEGGAPGESRPSKEIGYTRLVTGIASLVKMENFVLNGLNGNVLQLDG